MICHDVTTQLGWLIGDGELRGTSGRVSYMVYSSYCGIVCCMVNDTVKSKTIVE